MPAKNALKDYAPEAYYHVYNRGVGKRRIFKDSDDYAVFLNLLKRYLGAEPMKDKSGREYPSYRGQVELLAFCLMPNHYHLLVYQVDREAMTKLLRSVGTAYTAYFNQKYEWTGHLFQGRYKASMILDDAYLQHISRYIHLNPEKYRQWEFSSLPYYLGAKRSSWLNPQPMLDLFKGDSYSNFLSDYEDYKKTLGAIKYQLADR